MLLAMITAGMLSTAHTGTTPVVNVVTPKGPTAVFARPAPAPAKPLAHGPPLVLTHEPGVQCLQYNVDAALDAKAQPNANGDLHSQGASCYQGHPPRA
jgi:hypothetical protein